MTKKPALARDSRGRFLSRASASASIPAAVVTATVVALAIGCDRIDPVVALRREVLAPRLAELGQVGQLTRSVPCRADLRRAPGVVSWCVRNRVVGNVLAFLGLVAPIALYGWLRGIL